MFHIRSIFIVSKDNLGIYQAKRQVLKEVACIFNLEKNLSVKNFSRKASDMFLMKKYFCVI